VHEMFYWKLTNTVPLSVVLSEMLHFSDITTQHITRPRGSLQRMAPNNPLIVVIVWCVLGWKFVGLFITQQQSKDFHFQNRISNIVASFCWCINIHTGWYYNFVIPSSEWTRLILGNLIKLHHISRKIHLSFSMTFGFRLIWTC
jgi:hypothetical protein